MFVTFPTITVAEIFQIKTETTKIEKDVAVGRTCEELLDIQTLKYIVIEFINSDLGKKKTLMSEAFFSKVKDVTTLSPFMRESITRVNFIDVKTQTGSALLKTQIYWFSEGYEGDQTIFFDFIKKGPNKWLIDWLIY